jgi:predicted transposase YdaD
MKTDESPARGADPQLIVAHPHDLLVRHFLASPDLAADLLRNYVDSRIIDLLDIERLVCEPSNAVDRELREVMGDLRFSTCFRDRGLRAEVLVFLEHQSTADRFVRFRVLEYIVKAYGARLAEEGGAKGGPKKLPYVMAVVLYHGENPWRKIPSMLDLLADVPPELEGEPYLEYPLYLIDLAAMPEGETESRGLPAVRALLSALRAASSRRLSERFESIVSMLSEAGDDSRFLDWLVSIFRYAASRSRLEGGLETVKEAVRRVRGEREAEEMTTTLANELALKGFAKGREEGREEGLTKGREEGLTKGERESIARVLSARFGTVPDDIRRAIEANSDRSALESLTIHAAICDTIDDFRQKLR